jgi:hypothetical protein
MTTNNITCEKRRAEGGGGDGQIERTREKVEEGKQTKN